MAVLEMTEFAEWLGGELRARGSNRAKLAAAMGSKSQTVSAWFNEGRMPSPEFCLKIAEYLRVPPDDVLRRAGRLPALADELREERSEYDVTLAAIVGQLDDDGKRRLIRIAQALLEDEQTSS